MYKDVIVFMGLWWKGSVTRKSETNAYRILTVKAFRKPFLEYQEHDDIMIGFCFWGIVVEWTKWVVANGSCIEFSASATVMLAS